MMSDLSVAAWIERSVRLEDIRRPRMFEVHTVMYMGRGDFSRMQEYGKRVVELGYGVGLGGS